MVTGVLKEHAATTKLKCCENHKSHIDNFSGDATPHRLRRFEAF
jgi:hypothetical protein